MIFRVLLFLRLLYEEVMSVRVCQLVSVTAIIDSITQNEASKVAYDYVMMLRNNKFKTYTREKFWKQQQAEKKLS